MNFDHFFIPKNQVMRERNLIYSSLFHSYRKRPFPYSSLIHSKKKFKKKNPHLFSFSLIFI